MDSILSSTKAYNPKVTQLILEDNVSVTNESDLSDEEKKQKVTMPKVLHRL
jgi:hypothetical protein